MCIIFKDSIYRWHIWCLSFSDLLHLEWLSLGPSMLLLMALFLFCVCGWVIVQSILKEISPGCSLEGVMLKLKLQYFGHLMQRVDSLENPSGRDWRQEEKGRTRDELAGWHHWLDGREFEWTPGVGDGQGGLAWCNSWGLKESDMTERLNWTETVNSTTIKKP